MKLAGQRHRREMSNSESDVTEENIDFGSLLSEARKTQKYTVDEISEHIKIPVHFIVAIESNDLKRLTCRIHLPGVISALMQNFWRFQIRAYWNCMIVQCLRIRQKV